MEYKFTLKRRDNSICNITVVKDNLPDDDIQYCIRLAKNCNKLNMLSISKYVVMNVNRGGCNFTYHD